MIDQLANEIRRVDGGNKLGAGALAEALMPLMRRMVAMSPWPATAAEVRDFIGSNFISAEYATDSPHDDDKYVLTAHDFLSAVDFWRGEWGPGTDAQIDDHT